MISLTKESISGQTSQLTDQEKTNFNFVDLLPREIILEIFSHLSAEDLSRCQRVNKKFQLLASDESLWKALPPPKGAFGKKQWETYFGDVGKVPTLPKDIYKIFKRDTHMLVLIPETINGKKFTLATLGVLVKSPKKGPATKYREIWDVFVKRNDDHQTTNKSHWALITKNIINGTQNKIYKEQKALITELNEKTKMNYDAPNALDFITCIFMYYVRYGKRLFNDQPWTYTRCQKNDYGYDIIIGGFSPNGLFVGGDVFDRDIAIGMAAQQKFIETET